MMATVRRSKEMEGVAAPQQTRGRIQREFAAALRRQFGAVHGRSDESSSVPSSLALLCVRAVNAAIAKAAGRPLPCAAKAAGRRHPLDSLGPHDASVVVNMHAGGRCRIGVALYHSAGRRSIELVGDLPARVRRRLRRSHSWLEGEGLPVRYYWRCSETEYERFALRDADEALDLVQERAAWKKGSAAC